MAATRRTKQELADAVADLLGVPPDELGPGSKEHRVLLEDIARALCLRTYGTKHELAERILRELGAAWDDRCYSAGDTVQSEAFARMYDALSARMGPERAEFERESNRLLRQYNERSEAPRGNTVPSRSDGGGRQGDFIRSAEVSAWIQMKASGRCELCEKPAPFVRSNGIPYLEVHHVMPLAGGGPDTTANAVALCPTCHRMAHHAANRRDIRERLDARLQRRGY
jgi:5-methylcytosine-specific restriction endonuclease McrA